MFKYLAAAKIIFHEKAQADNTVFYLHYRITCLIFLVSSMLVTAREFFGASMLCFGSGKSGVPTHVMNTYCFFGSTFSLTKYWNHTLTDRPESIPYFGVGVGSPGVELGNSGVVWHLYYQWVPAVLFLQACFFYFPRYIWKSLEGGLFRTLLGGLDKFSMDGGARAKKYKVLVTYLSNNLHMHKNWSIRFFLCEALNLVNVVGNIYFTNYFLGGTFLSYGTEVANFPDIDPENRVDPMSRIFPKMAKCTFRKYGASGTLETIDALCLLPINIINEKIYIFLWFWLIFMSALTALWLVYRLCTLASPALRNGLISIRGRCAGKPNLKIITDRCDLGDWFMLYQLGCHMEPTVYGEFLKQFAKELENGLSTMERKPMLKDN